MNSNSSTNEPEAAVDPRWPSQGIRTVASLALFIHLFAVGIAMTSRATTIDTETGPAGSELLTRVRGVPLLMQYLQLLELDESYNFAWTQGGPMDAGNSIEVDLEYVDQDAGPRTVRIPQDLYWPPLRAERHRNLTLTAAALVGNENQENIIPQAIAERLIANLGAASGTIRIVRHYPQSPLESASLDTAVADPFNARYYDTIYEARILVNDGKVSLLKSESPGTSAPAARGPANVPLPTGEASP